MSDIATTPRSIVRVKDLQQKSRRLEVVPLTPEQGRYFVTSAAKNGSYYEVTLARDGLGGSCSCPWGQYGGENCKHVLAALREHYASQGQISFWSSLEQAQRQHRHMVQGERLYGTLRRV